MQFHVLMAKICLTVLVDEGKSERCMQGRNRHSILRGQSHFFLIFFPGMKCFFPVENSHFGKLKTNFGRFQKWKAKKKKKKKGPHLFLYKFFLLFFSIFTPFPFFPCLFFPRYTSAKISQSEVLGGTLPPPVTPLGVWMNLCNFVFLNMERFVDVGKSYMCMSKFMQFCVLLIKIYF